MTQTKTILQLLAIIATLLAAFFWLKATTVLMLTLDSTVGFLRDELRATAEENRLAVWSASVAAVLHAVGALLSLIRR